MEHLTPKSLNFADKLRWRNRGEKQQLGYSSYEMDAITVLCPPFKKLWIFVDTFVESTDLTVMILAATTFLLKMNFDSYFS